MKAILLKIAVTILRIIYAPIKLCRVREKITFVSRQSDNASQDVRLLCDCIAGTRPDVKVKIMAKKIGGGPGGLIAYGFHMIAQMYHIATSRVVVTDGYCICVSVLSHKKETTFIQTWHALCAVKKFGYQSLDKPSGSSRALAEAMRMHKNYDYFIAASEKTAAHFAEAFNTDISRAKLFGLPRIDVMLTENEEKGRLIREKYGITPAKKVILYAPTFRKGQNLPLQAVLENFDLQDAVLVIKPHPLDETPLPQVHGDNVIFDGEFGTYDWAHISDKIITDYSAFALEGTLLGVPMYFFVYDCEEYRKDPGLNIDMCVEMGRYAQTGARELFDVMKEEYDFTLLDDFKNRYITVDTKNCTEKLAGFITGFVR